MIKREKQLTIKKFIYLDESTLHFQHKSISPVISTEGQSEGSSPLILLQI